MPGSDPYDLQRFVTAQESVYATALAELRGGAKITHWMWFIFPQIEGLGSSPTARYYSIKSREEAQQYLLHPILGPRLLECSQTLLSISDRSASEIFGFPDDLKLRSSMTLFASLPDSQPVFSRVLDKYFGGERDERTLSLLGRLGG